MLDVATGPGYAAARAADRGAFVVGIDIAQEAAAEFARVLVPGGRLALSMWDVPERSRILGLFVDAVQEVGAGPPAEVPPGPPVFRFAEDEELVGLLRGAGLGEVEVRPLAFTHRVLGPDALGASL